MCEHLVLLLNAREQVQTMDLPGVQSPLTLLPGLFSPQFLRERSLENSELVGSLICLQ